MEQFDLDSPTIVIDGAARRASRLRLGDYRELERRFAATRPVPLGGAREQLSALPEPWQRHLLELAFEATLRSNSPTVEELRRWLLSIEGLSAALELGLRDAGLKERAESCRRAVYAADGARRAELLRVVEFVVGMRLCDEGDLGNDRGRSAAVSASAGESDQEPDWIGELCATD